MRENELFFEAGRLAGAELRFDPLEAAALFEEDGHLSDAGLQALVNDQLSELERLEAAEHLGFCEACMDRYTALLTGEALYAPPADLAVPVARRVRQKSVRLNLRRYAAAAAAAAVALTLWGSGAFSQMVPQQTDILQQPPPEPPARTESLGSRVSDTLYGMLGAAGDMCGGLFQAGWSAPPEQQPAPAQPDADAQQDAAAQQEPGRQPDAAAQPQAGPENEGAQQAPGRPANSGADPARGDRFEEGPAQALAREPASAMRGEQ